MRKDRFQAVFFFTKKSRPIEAVSILGEVGGGLSGGGSREAGPGNALIDQRLFETSAQTGAERLPPAVVQL